MRLKTALSGFVLLAAMTTSAGDITPLLDRMASTPTYRARALYSVLLPSAEDEIAYTVDLCSEAVSDDPLSDCDFLISWTLPTPSGLSEGFSAYSGGSLYRYRDQRLQEYHYSWDSIPFLTAGGGVIGNTQFAELLPSRVARTIRELTESSAPIINTSAVYDGHEAVEITGVEERNNYVSRNYRFVIDKTTALPLLIDYENNPGSISEQTVTVKFLTAVKNPDSDFSEEALIEMYPEVFERFRQSNFRVENMPGTLLPQFSLPQPDGRRMTHHRGEQLASPVVIVFLDPEVATVAQTVRAVRNAVTSLPIAFDIIWAINSTNPSHAEAITGNGAPGETTLISARPLARDCGVNAYPTLLFADRSGVIKSVQLGFNKELESIVIEKASLAGLQ